MGGLLMIRSILDAITITLVLRSDRRARLEAGAIPMQSLSFKARR